MTTFIRYDNEVLVPTPGPILQFNQIDIGPLLENPNAVAVIVRFTTAGIAAVQCLLKEIATTLPVIGNKIERDSFNTSIVSLINGTVLEERRGDSGVKLFMTGEVLANDGAVLNAIPIDITLGEPFATWNDFQPTPQAPDLVSDISVVIIRTSNDETGKLGLREKGSVDPDWFARWEGGTHWWLVGLDAGGFFQLFTDGKAGGPPLGGPFNFFQEVGSGSLLLIS